MDQKNPKSLCLGLCIFPLFPGISCSVVATALKSTNWRFSGLNHPDFRFVGLVLKSPTHTGLICVKFPEPNISSLGPFNRVRNVPERKPPEESEAAGPGAESPELVIPGSWGSPLCFSVSDNSFRAWTQDKKISNYKGKKTAPL
jgi:hypothetical protein